MEPLHISMTALTSNIEVSVYKLDYTLLYSVTSKDS
jgi:hypothetical protein